MHSGVVGPELLEVMWQQLGCRWAMDCLVQACLVAAAHGMHQRGIAGRGQE